MSGGPDILLIEDSPADAGLVEEWIADGREGEVGRLWHADRLQAGLEVLTRRKPDLIITDLGLPDADGLRVVERLRAASQAPIVVLTGRDDANLGAEAVRRGADDYLHKGTATSELFRRSVRHAIERRAYARRSEVLQQRLERADRLAAIGRMAAGVAHEINNPAAYIMGTLELAREDLATIARGEGGPAKLAELDEALVSSLEGISRIGRIVTDIRSVARSANEDARALDLNHVVRSAVTLLTARLTDTVELSTDLQPLPNIVGRHGKLVQVVTNVLSNAIDAVQAGAGRKIEVTSFLEGEELVLAIEDAGIGIDVNVRDQIFDSFFTTKDADGGLGLGLALSAEIVRAHGGRIEVSSEVGEGSRFEIRIPRDTGIKSAEPPQPAQASARPAGRVLIVDDEPALRTCLERVLGRDCEAVSVCGGAEALELVEAGQEFEAVVSDLCMPGMSGRRFYEVLCERRPEYANRFVFITGAARTPELHEFLELVDCPLLLKPFEMQELRRTVAQVRARARGVAPIRVVS